MNHKKPQDKAVKHTPYGPNHSTVLSHPTADRELVHQRRIEVDGYVRKDGLFDVEATLTDHKTYSFPNDFRGEVTPDLPVHHMTLRITLTKERVITSAEAITIVGPYAVCPKANEIFPELVGITIAPGWRRQVNKAIGGRSGCTHITELLGPVATTAYQTLYGHDTRIRRTREHLSDTAKQQDRANLLNTCVGYATDPL